MPTIESLKDKYELLAKRFEERDKNAIDAACLLCFDYEYTGLPSEIIIDTEEFTAVCPWTDLPDFGTVKITYTPNELCLELKSLKYYLMSYSAVEIVQEHAANHILEDLIKACQPATMTVLLDYKIRGGLHTTVSVSYP